MWSSVRVHEHRNVRFGNRGLKRAAQKGINAAWSSLKQMVQKETVCMGCALEYHIWHNHKAFLAISTPTPPPTETPPTSGISLWWKTDQCTHFDKKAQGASTHPTSCSTQRVDPRSCSQCHRRSCKESPLCDHCPLTAVRCQPEYCCWWLGRSPLKQKNNNTMLRLSAVTYMPYIKEQRENCKQPVLPWVGRAFVFACMLHC